MMVIIMMIYSHNVVVNGLGARPYNIKINIITFLYIYLKSCVWDRRHTVEGVDKFNFLNISLNDVVRDPMSRL
jgi:hypothetical protein